MSKMPKNTYPPPPSLGETASGYLEGRGVAFPKLLS
jgi:hypothetical protein